MNCEKTRTLCPSSTTSADLRQEHVELGAGLVGAGRVDQAGVAGGLAEPQQGLEDLDLRPVQLGRRPCAGGPAR